MEFNDRRLLLDRFGATLPGANKSRSYGEWQGRANVIAAARVGSIKKAPKRK